MKSFLRAVLFLAMSLSPAVAAAVGRTPLKLAQIIPMPNVEGRIDHLAVDLVRHRLFVAALGNNTLEVINLETGRKLQSIPGLAEPQGVAFDSGADRIYVANGESGACTVFDSSYTIIQNVMLGGDADNVRFDPAANRIWVGYGSGALGSLDVATGEKVGDISLQGHPESFQLESRGPRIFVNVPAAGHIAVIDRTENAVTTTWPVVAASANFPMALDETGGRLFIGCRRPALVLVYDIDSGKLKTSLDIGGDTDDLFYDGKTERLYVICGEGKITTFDESATCKFEALTDTRTAPGARTGLFVPQLGRLYLAVPHRGEKKAEIRVYAVEK